MPMETEHNETLPFLDILIIKQADGTLTTQVYHKPTYTGLYLRWDSFVQKQCLIHRAWHICSCSEHFSQEMDFVKYVLMKNGYPQNFINSIFKKFLQSKYKADIKYPVFGPLEIYISLPYCCIQSQKLARQLKRIYSKIAPWANLFCIFKSVRKLNSLSKLKSPYKLLSQSGVVYKIRCLDCQEFCIGLTQQFFK